MIKIVEWNNNKLHCIQRLIDNELEWCFFGKEVVSVLGYKLDDKTTAVKYIKKFCDEDEYINVKAKDIILSYPELKQNGFEIGRKGEYLLTKTGVCKLIQGSTMSLSKREEFKEFLIGNNLIEDKFVVKTRKEINFIDELEEALKPFDILGVRQYGVLNYRIDFYIPNLNIAIEYDENNHNGYTYEEHEGRQKEIEKELGCRFIRVSDKNTNGYNIGHVIKEIFCINLEQCV